MSDFGAQLPSWAGSDLGDLSPRVVLGDPEEADVLLLVDTRRARWIRRARDRRVMIGDPRYYSSVEVESYASLSSLTTSPDDWERIRQDSEQALTQLQRLYQGAERIAVFGTGPSMTSIDPASLQADVTIACNSAVSNSEWLAAAQPAVVAFADPVFHFGPSRYASRFRTDLERVVEQTDAVFVVPERFAPLLRSRIPELTERLIAVSHQSGERLDGLSADHLVVPQTANVLTMLMLPVAAALGTHVLVAGCDGRRPTERYFWNHNREAQYGDDLMHSAFEAHPSFFRDRDYGRYYDIHCAQLEQMLASAEGAGYSFVAATKSEIPALRRRAKDRNQS